MRSFKVTSDVMLQLNKSGWEKEPIAVGVSASSSAEAIKRYQSRVREIYVENGQFLDVEFENSNDAYVVQSIDKKIKY